MGCNRAGKGWNLRRVTAPVLFFVAASASLLAAAETPLTGADCSPENLNPAPSTPLKWLAVSPPAAEKAGTVLTAVENNRGQNSPASFQSSEPDTSPVISPAAPVSSPANAIGEAPSPIPGGAMPADAGDWPFDGPPQAAGDNPDDYAAPAGRPCDDSQYWNNRCDGRPNCVCCRPLTGQVWVRSDYLLWWTRGAQLPPLVTASPPGTSVPDAGVLGVPGTTILYGDSTVNGGSRSGFNITAGCWLDCCHAIAIQGDYFDLGRSNDSYDSGCSNGTPILARPFFDATNGAGDSELIAYPDLLAGRVTAQSSSYFQSAGLDLRKNVYCCECCDCCGPCRVPMAESFRVDAIVGYRYYNDDDSVSVHESLVVLGGLAPVGTAFDVQDSFRARNAFNGGELGLVVSRTCCRWSWEATLKAAFGCNQETIDINGQTIITTPDGQAARYSGGLLALDTNIGHYTHNEFLVIPQIGLQLGYQLADHLRAEVGYDFLYWGQMARAAEQINLNIDPNNIPPNPSGGPEPRFVLQQTSFWAQGIHVGGELRF
jgi:hypothetical protein